jgi:hypothetical protein
MATKGEFVTNLALTPVDCRLKPSSMGKSLGNRKKPSAAPCMVTGALEASYQTISSRSILPGTSIFLSTIFAITAYQ